MGYSRYGSEGKGLTDAGERAYASKLKPGGAAHKSYTTYLHDGVRKASGTFQAIGHTAASLGYGSGGGVTADPGWASFGSKLGAGLDRYYAGLKPHEKHAFTSPLITSESDYLAVIADPSYVDSFYSVSSSASVVSPPSADSGVVSDVHYPSGGFYGGESEPKTGLYLGVGLLVAALYISRRK